MARRLAERARVDLAEHLQLVVAAEKRRPARRLEVDAQAAAGAERPPERHRLGLPLRRDRLKLFVLDRVPRRPVRLLAGDEAARRRRGLEARGGVDDVSGDDPLAELRPGVERDDGLACVDRGPCLEVELLHRLEDGKPRPHAPLGVVLVRDGGAEDGHDGVADELLDRAAEPLDLGLRARVVALEAGTDVLGVGRLRGGGEADEVDEEHRDDLALLARGRLGDERLGADHAEAGPVGVLLAAAGAGDGHSRTGG
jgi:hypothetical protein